MAGFAQPTIYVLYVLVFGAVAALALGLQIAWLQAHDRTTRINRRLSLLSAGASQQQVYSILVRQPKGLAAGPTGRWMRLYNQFSAYLRQADMTLSPERLAAITAGAALAIWLVGLTFMSLAGRTLLLSVSASLLGACALAILGAAFVVRNRRVSRLRRIEQQLPLALDIINRAIRAGHPVVAAVQLAAGEMHDPLGSELGLIVDETTYGVEFKDALSNFARRTDSPDARFFAVSVAIQSGTGGNLAEILEGLAKVMRDRANLAKRVKVLASEGRASAYILSVLPPAMIGVQLVLHPATYLDKLSDPIFWPTVGAVSLLYLAGWAIIYRIINFKY